MLTLTVFEVIMEKLLLNTKHISLFEGGSHTMLKDVILVRDGST